MTRDAFAKGKAGKNATIAMEDEDGFVEKASGVGSLEDEDEEGKKEEEEMNIDKESMLKIAKVVPNSRPQSTSPGALDRQPCLCLEAPRL